MHREQSRSPGVCGRGSIDLQQQQIFPASRMRVLEARSPPMSKF
jgi:hypothetical protein